jgi:hypothetical protein
MALDRASVVAYLQHHTQLEAAVHFGVSERYIRKLKAGDTLSAVSSSAAAGVAGRAGGSEVSLPKSLQVSQHTSNSDPASASSTNRLGRFVPRLDCEVAGSSAYWLDAVGVLQRVTAGTTGAAWNALQRGELCTAPALSDVTGPVPVPVPVFERESSGPVPVVFLPHAPVALHNTIVSPSGAVRRSAPSRPGVDALGWFLTASLGPLPLPAVVVFLALLVLIGGA